MTSLAVPEKKEIKIALAMIVKGDDGEAKLLAKCLENVAPYVDGIFLTSTHLKGKAPNKKIDELASLYGANISYFEWIKDFAAARNFNFSQVTPEYDYILWCDADDTFLGLEKLREVITSNPSVDAYGMWYLYDFDEYGLATVVHKKTMVVRNDGTFSWVGKIHEEVISSKQVDTYLIQDVKRIHGTNNERIIVAQKRNVDVSLADLEANPNDPRTLWNLANSYLGANKPRQAKTTYKKFIKESSSDEEKYLAYMRLGGVEFDLGNRAEAILSMQTAIGIRPEYPDAYLQLARLLFDFKDLDRAESYALQGLVKKPPYHSIIVYNPRDYDYNPMMLLAKIYFHKSRPDLALPMLKGCQKIYPENEQIKRYVEEMTKEFETQKRVIESVRELDSLDDKEEVLRRIDGLPDDMKSHPAISVIRNRHRVKETSTGKDIVFYCGFTTHEWNPQLFRTKGFGGSEEAVVNLSKEFAKAGWNVIVYNSCGYKEIKEDGVTYRPTWEFNPKDKQDIVIFWRHPKMLDYEINCENIYIDMHDVINQAEFTAKRVAKIKKIFVKTKAHRECFSNVPDEKFVIIPNGQDFSLFNQEIEKDQYLMINTSSPDRSMDVLPKLFKRVKERVPQAKLKWAYGWDVFDSTFASDIRMMKWKKGIDAAIKDAGIIELGKIPQSECAKLYLEGNIIAYPSEFYEIDCISVKKAQACGCIPITTDFAALAESVQFGIKVHSKKNVDNWSLPYQYGYGIQDQEAQDAWVDAVVEQLQKPIGDRTEMKEWAKQFSWDKIAARWINELTK